MLKGAVTWPWRCRSFQDAGRFICVWRWFWGDFRHIRGRWSIGGGIYSYSWWCKLKNWSIWLVFWLHWSIVSKATSYVLAHKQCCLKLSICALDKSYPFVAVLLLINIFLLCIQYRSKVSWQSLASCETRLKTRFSILENFENRVSSRFSQLASWIFRVSSREK